eukprot:jgi/Psemu1/915/gm1.915_g
METIKTHWISVMSTPGAKYCTGDISNMYLCSTPDKPEFVKFRWDIIPPRIRVAYKLEGLKQGDYVYARIKKAWYGLKQSGKIAHDDLVAHLQLYGYRKAPHTEGLFLHDERDISFTLVVDDFGIKYTLQEDVDHLVEAVGAKYTFKADWTGQQYVGVHLVGTTTNVNIKGIRTREAHTHIRGTITRGRTSLRRKIQYTKLEDTTTLSDEEIKFIQQVTGKFLFYARAVDNTMLHALNDIASSQNNHTALAATKYFLNYAACNPDATIIYRASDMVLRIDSDAGYLVSLGAKSRAGGYHYLGDTTDHTFNGPILMLAKIINNVMAPAAEAECLIELGHPQPATPMKTDNNTAEGILNGTIKQKRSKAIDMRFYWLKDRAEQGQFNIFWEPGKHNLADYPTKRHPGSHHKKGVLNY